MKGTKKREYKELWKNWNNWFMNYHEEDVTSLPLWGNIGVIFASSQPLYRMHNCISSETRREFRLSRFLIQSEEIYVVGIGWDIYVNVDSFSKFLNVTIALFFIVIIISIHLAIAISLIESYTHTYTHKHTQTLSHLLK